MPQLSPGADFPERADDNRRLWDANAAWWDDKIGDGNEVQDLLIAPASERLLAVHPGDTVLDIACGAGRLTRRLAELGTRVTAFDRSEAFIERALASGPVSLSTGWRSRASRRRGVRDRDCDGPICRRFRRCWP
jgi:2-polyprenyl-3-methyl-5-hydroxy-6-metoxy-1,4-benzoquinol methylase